jgi:hypothetical protein
VLEGETKQLEGVEGIDPLDSRPWTRFDIMYDEEEHVCVCVILANM